MAIKSILKGENSYKSFPKLMKSNTSGLICLMTSPEVGTVIFPGSSPWKVGDFDKCWRLDEDFSGSIVLENE